MAALVAALAVPARADERAAVIAPLSGPFAAYGQQIGTQARALLGANVPVLDDGCNAEIAAGAARTAARGQARIVIGMPCVDAFDAAMPVLAQSSIAVLAVGIEAPDITRAPPGAADWPVFRVGPPATQEARVLADHLGRAWRDAAFAVIDDGTLYGRQLAETVRQMLAERALEPVFSDSYRPLVETQAALVRRLQRAGATHALIGGDARDAAVIAADAARLGYDLTLAGGGFLLAPDDDGRLPDGTLIAAVPQDTDLPQMAAQIASQALMDEARGPIETLRQDSFATQFGPLSFGADGEPDIAFYRIHVIAEGVPVPLPDEGVLSP